MATGEDGVSGTPAGASGLDDTILHASCVALNGRAVLITGKSGSGKSALALQLMAYGAMLVADDRTVLRQSGSALTARAPSTIRGKIEARGVGILRAQTAAEAEVVLAVDMDRIEEHRLPHPQQVVLLGHSIPLCRRAEAAHFAAAILQYLREGRDA
ncbi:MAG: HPr kinase/phosphorylase [Shimia sp.]|jgi:HPr kinase/phosphorylase|uniref:HPr kinase/phosphorylase n=1 Tax=Shimia sp. TaxID=1954381 RepID=UPI004057E43D